MIRVKATGKINPSPEGLKQDIISGKEYYSIYVSSLASTIGYCEYKVPLFADGAKTITTDAMKIGSKVHKRLEKEEEKEKDFVSLSHGEILQLLKEGEKIDFKMEGLNGCLVHKKFHYIGRMDTVHSVTSREFTIEEVKTQNVKDGKKPTVYPGHLIQALAYARMASEKYAIPLTKGKLRFRIIDRLTDYEFDPVVMPITKKEVAFFYNALKRFERLYLKKASPQFYGTLGKCVACNPGYKERCPYVNGTL